MGLSVHTHVPNKYKTFLSLQHAKWYFGSHWAVDCMLSILSCRYSDCRQCLQSTNKHFSICVLCEKGTIVWEMCQQSWPDKFIYMTRAGTLTKAAHMKTYTEEFNLIFYMLPFIAFNCTGVFWLHSSKQNPRAVKYMYRTVQVVNWTKAAFYGFCIYIFHFKILVFDNPSRVLKGDDTVSNSAVYF